MTVATKPATVLGELRAKAVLHLLSHRVVRRIDPTFYEILKDCGILRRDADQALELLAQQGKIRLEQQRDSIIVEVLEGEEE